MLAATLACCGVWAGPAAAQTDADKEHATQLFEQGLAHLDRGDTERACGLFEQAFDLVPGIGIQYQLAACFEKLGRTASAHRHFVEVAEVARRAGQDDRAKVAGDRAAALEPRLSKLVVKVDQPVAGLTIRYNDTELPRAKWSTPIAVDPGRYLLRAEAPGFDAWMEERDLSVEGNTVTVRVPPFSTPGDEGDDDGGGSWTPWHTAGVVAAAVGVAAMGASIGVAVAAKSKDDEAAEHCDGSGCDPEGIALNEDARALGDAGTGLFIGGAVVAAAGAGLLIYAFVSADDAPAVAPLLGPGYLGVRASF